MSIDNYAMLSRILAALFQQLPRPDHLILSPGEDDCGVVLWQASSLVATMDFLNRRPLMLEYGLGAMEDLGALLVKVNVGDLIGSGAKPLLFLFGIQIPSDYRNEDAKAVARGVQRECLRWRVTVIGGDTKRGDQLNLAGTAIGEPWREGHIWKQGAAQPSDRIAVSGPVGMCSAAVHFLANQNLPPSDAEPFVRAIVAPELPYDVACRTALQVPVHAGADASDGLGTAIELITSQSGVGATIDLESIPTPDFVRRYAAEHHVPIEKFVLGLGGDLQFVITFPQTAEAVAVACGITTIGQITANREIQLLTDGDRIPWVSFGHFDSADQNINDAYLDRIAGQ